MLDAPDAREWQKQLWLFGCTRRSSSRSSALQIIYAVGQSCSSPSIRPTAPACSTNRCSNQLSRPTRHRTTAHGTEYVILLLAQRPRPPQHPLRRHSRSLAMELTASARGSKAMCRARDQRGAIDDCTWFQLRMLKRRWLGLAGVAAQPPPPLICPVLHPHGLAALYILASARSWHQSL